MSARRKKLRRGTRVKVVGTRFGRWVGKIASECFGMYHVDMTHDADGERLACRYQAGPFARKELRLLRGAASRPRSTLGAKDGAIFSELEP